MTVNKSFLLTLLLLFLASPLAIHAQDSWGKTGLNTLWQGLRQIQPEDQLPKGNAPFQIPQRVPKQNIPTRLVPTGANNEWIISDGWELGTSTQVLEAQESIFSPSFNTSGWYNATVPGTVLTTLVNQGVYPEPSYGLNNMAIPDTLCRMDWWYRTTFDQPEATSGKRTSLIFEGINYRAEVFLNGKKLGNIDGAFIRTEYDITSQVKNKGNVLAVLIHPPYNPGISHEQSMVAGQGLNGGQLSLDGPTFIASMGWDWIPGIRDRNIGIWQDVKLKTGGDVQIGYPHVITKLPLPDTSNADITIEVPVKNLSASATQGVVKASFDNVNISMPYSLSPGEEKTLTFTPAQYSELNLKNPRLWWPNGYGEPNLYNLVLTAEAGNGVSDIKKLRFGIRELSYELMIHTPEKGNHRVLYTPVDADNNNQPVFNYEKVMLVGNPRSNQAIPTLQDGVDEAKVLQPLSNDDPMGQFLVFRVNGKRIFIKGATWGMDEMMKRISRETMEPAFRLEKEANFNMVRNWTGENTEELFYELADEYGLLVWNDFWITTDDTVDPNDHVLFMKNATDVVRRFRTHPSIAIWCPRNEGYAPKGLEPQLNAMVTREDPTRHYHGNSRLLNAVNSGPYGFIKDRSQYYTRFANGFNTELGAQSIPTANTIRKFIAPEDQWPINDVWAYHDLHHTTHFFEDFMEAVNSYGKANSMEEFSKNAQFVSYDTWRAIMEGVHSKMWNNTSGLILWMTHPSWPSMTWQIYTYDYETPGAYFGMKKALEPLHIQMNLNDNQVVIINNTQNDENNLTATVRYFDIFGKQSFTKTGRFNAPAINKTECFTLSPVNGFTLVRLELKNKSGKVVSINDYWMNGGNLDNNSLLNTLEDANVTATVKGFNKSTGKTTIEVRNSGKSIAAAIKLNALNKNTGEFILPAFFSDGYFNLLPGEKRNIELSLPDNSVPFTVAIDGYNVK